LAHIFKKPTKQKGVIIFTHKEVGCFQSKPSILNKIGNIKNQCFIGVHFGGFSKGVAPPPYADFVMGRTSVVDSHGKFQIDLASANFTPSFFQPTNQPHYWDIIHVARPSLVKRPIEFIKNIKKLYNLGYKFKVLWVCPTRKEEEPRDHLTDVAEIYRSTFTPAEQELFTLLRLGNDLGYLGLSQRQLAYFYQHSKVITLFSDTEGSPKVITEGLLCGCDVVVYSGLRGSGRDFLDSTNSVMFNNYDYAFESLITAVERVCKVDVDKVAGYMREDKTVPKLKEKFNKLYQRNAQKFDGELINTDYLNLRLPAHFTNLPWGRGDFYTSDIMVESQFDIFMENLYGKL
jgi:G:T-mismatch repair DNA endonuclease (very short patch repair protein)